MNCPNCFGTGMSSSTSTLRCPDCSGAGQYRDHKAEKVAAKQQAKAEAEAKKAATAADKAIEAAEKAARNAGQNYSTGSERSEQGNDSAATTDAKSAAAADFFDVNGWWRALWAAAFIGLLVVLTQAGDKLPRLTSFSPMDWFAMAAVFGMMVTPVLNSILRILVKLTVFAIIIASILFGILLLLSATGVLDS